MQRYKIFLYATNVLRTFLFVCVIIALLQNYVFTGGTFSIAGISLTQFYDHVEIRIIPLLWVSFYLVPTVLKLLDIQGKFYLSEFLIALLVTVDAFTHINNVYSYSFTFFNAYTLWFDKIMHFSEGVVLMAALYPIVYRYLKGITLATINVSNLTYWVTAGFISIFFIAWEITEVVIDKWNGTHLITSIFDTNEDLGLAYIGIFIGVLMVESYKFLYAKYLKDAEDADLLLK